MYTFRKIKLPNWERPQWYFIPKTLSDVIDHFNTIVRREIKAGCKEYVEEAIVTPTKHIYHPHPDTPFGIGVDVLSNTFKIPWIEAALRLENQTLQDRIELFRKPNTINLYLGDGITWFAEYAGMNVEVFEEIELKEIIYPLEEVYKYEDVRYMKWDIPGMKIKGTHWYAKVDNIDIIDKDGNMKWNTEQEAHLAAKWFIDNYNKKASKFKWICGQKYSVNEEGKKLYKK